MTGFVLRAPWYVRERARSGVRDPAMYRPAIQMYDGADLVDRLLRDPRDSLVFDDVLDDVWSYPVPATPSGTGRARLATFELLTTKLRKLYQPNHNRFYAVVVEVFCDSPGLPRAGGHDDIEVGFVVRRHVTSLVGGPSRKLARNLLVEMVKEQRKDPDLDEQEFAENLGCPGDLRDTWFADRAWRARVTEDNSELIDQVAVTTVKQGWIAPKGELAGWRPVPNLTLAEHEETIPMWRLPGREDECDRAQTRSTWFGLVPTSSADHHVDADGSSRPRYDDSAIFEINCFVRQELPPGHEHCPPRIWLNDLATEPFRLASATDPQGTSKRLTSITLPDLRRLAARAGQPMGPGGVQIITPPGSQLSFNPFGGVPATGSGAVGGAGQICMFALELFFIVAFFLFLMFLPIVVLAFQLWWMLALRFCIPPSIAFGITADFFADAKLLTAFEADLEVAAQLQLIADAGGPDLTPGEAFDQVFGTDSTGLADKGEWIDELAAGRDPDGVLIGTQPDFMEALVSATDPSTAADPAPPELEPVPPDPLCAAQDQGEGP